MQVKVRVEGQGQGLLGKVAAEGRAKVRAWVGVRERAEED